ncbi:amino acid adenylation domain-containing protein [bacterium]|nr:amino acid adenylation domain-containing protein [bacterium]
MNNSAKIQHILPLTPMQEGILFNYLQSPNSEAYFEQTAFNIHGDIDMETVFHSFEIWVKRHDIFRTLFIYRDVEKPKQIVLHHRKCTVFFNDLSSEDETGIGALIEAYQKQDRKRGFDLSRDMPIRLAVFRIGKEIYRFIFSFHHIILDGWSFGLLMSEFFEIYQPLRQNQKVHCEKNHSFRQYVLWLQKQNFNHAYAYWTRYLNDYENPVKLPGRMTTRYSSSSYDRQVKDIAFTRAVCQSIQELTRTNQITLNTFIQAIWGILLQRYNNTDDVVFGTVVSGRHAEIDNIDRTVGLLINAVPVRVTASPQMTVTDLFQAIHTRYAASSQYDFCSLSEIQSRSGFSGDLINHVLVFENYMKADVVKAFLGDTHEFPFYISDVSLFEQTNYDFNLLVIPGERLQIKIIFNAKIFSSQTIERILGHFRKTVQEVLKNPKIKIHMLDILPDTEKKQLMQNFQAETVNMPPFKPLQCWFEEQAEKSPDRTAVCDESGEITYGELNTLANQWAWYLKELGIGPEVIAGVFMERSIDLIVGMLAVLKAGGAYLPLDISTPKARVKKILRSSRMKCMLTQASHVDKISSEIPIVIIDHVKDISGYSVENPPVSAEAGHLMYVIYTSGSTGEPKGVMVEHGGFHNLLCNLNYLFHLSPEDRCSQVASPSFDAMGFEIWPCFTNGSELYFVPGHICKDPIQIFQWIKDNNITFSFQVTAISELLISMDWPDSSCLRILCTGGDRLKKYPPRNLPFKLYNVYGPTEDSVVTSCCEIHACDSKFYTPPIGYPLNDHFIYILDNFKRIQPIGCEGELFIGGAGLARGYINDEKLTKQKFIQIPIFKNGRLYKTGDIVSWLENGALEYIGRKDFQVKIGGHRIELGEIESLLMNMPGIQDCVAHVMQNDSGIVSLGAYYSADRIYEYKDLKSYLQKELPIYMVPDYFFQLEQLPYNTNGKIDRKMLPKPRRLSSGPKNRQGPRNAVEATLCNQWKAVLIIDAPSINDDFFKCGGNSVKAIQLQARLSAQYHMKIQDIYDCPTIALLAERVTKKPEDFTVSAKSIANKLESIDRESLQSSLGPAIRQYKNKVHQELPDKMTKPDYPENIFFTGATGFLGAHLFYDLLHFTRANIYCLIRGPEEKVIEQRLKDTLAFYFNTNIGSQFSSRIKLFAGDIGQEKFGLDLDQYHRVASDVDCIINTAANVKHFGPVESFSGPNVAGVSELLRLMSMGRSKILHHISTTSVGMAYSDRDQSILFTEYHENEQLSHENPYIHSKLQAENLIFQARKNNLDARIYRVGNLVFHSKTGQFQKNIQDNAFYQAIRALLLLGMIPDIPRLPLEFSPIDAVSSALMKLFFQKAYFQKTFHVYHPDMIEIGKLGNWFNQWNPDIRVLPGKLFFDELYRMIEKNGQSLSFHAILQYFQILIRNDVTHCIPSNYKTNVILKNLNFQWPVICEDHVFRMLKHGRSVNFW